VRNPYAQIQSNIRRYNTDIKIATNKYISYLKFQKSNIEKLTGVLVLSYEELADNPIKAKKEITTFLPSLSDINTDLQFNAHNMHKKKKMAIKNLNKENISALSKDQIQIINSLLSKEKELINYFNYSLL
tara:strand:+ start:666 stop:1055 length:390 start_codon:yes stop_codon:yes gene_type:complete